MMIGRNTINGLSPKQQDYIKKLVEKKKNKGAVPEECPKCKKMTFYMYESFDKREDREYLFACVSCFDRETVRSKPCLMYMYK